MGDADRADGERQSGDVTVHSSQVSQSPQRLAVSQHDDQMNAQELDGKKRCLRRQAAEQQPTYGRWLPGPVPDYQIIESQTTQNGKQCRPGGEGGIEAEVLAAQPASNVGD